MVSGEGFPLGYEVFPGNTHDSRTLQRILATLEAPHGAVGRGWITRSRDGERGQLSVAAREWSSLPHRGPEVGTKEVRAGPRDDRRLARAARRNRGHARTVSCDRRHDALMSRGRAA